MTEGFLRQSLARWQGRLRTRRSLLQRAEQRLEEARRADLHPRDQLVKLVRKRRRQVAEARQMIERRHGQIAALARDADGFKDGVDRVPLEDAGPYVTGRPKICWHSTEGSTIEGAISAYRQKRASPHFTIDPSRKRLVQHIGVLRAARALEHRPGTVETNRARTVQVEIVGNAANMSRLPPDRLAFIADLARWIERTTDVASTCTVDFVPFPSGVPRRFAGQAWLNYSGHHGHMHVPNQSHEDPGALDIRKLLA
jgi:hypothetical protein